MKNGVAGFLFFLFFFFETVAGAQTNLLLNGGFEDINTCTEYQAECGVEGWFYLKDVKAQMLANTVNTNLLGNNSFGIFFNWNSYKSFSPAIGTILPCRLQPGKDYIFRGLIAAKLNPRLVLIPGICIGPRFYVPGRPFVKDMTPDSIPELHPVPSTAFYSFEYRFKATGTEEYLTFGTIIREDTTGAKKRLYGIQTVSLTLDNFSLTPADDQETFCDLFEINKEKIYAYNFRHREMDYSLFGKGLLSLTLERNDSNATTSTQKWVPPPQVLHTDTLLLSDVLFDYNKAVLKPAALRILENYFFTHSGGDIDSIYIEGHTDSIGSDKSNLTLSTQRCESVREWLQKNQEAEPLELFIHPFGRSRPVATNQTAAGRALNRRVELIIFRRRK